jgi:hypothetical protein
MSDEIVVISLRPNQVNGRIALIRKQILKTHRIIQMKNFGIVRDDARVYT